MGRLETDRMNDMKHTYINLKKKFEFLADGLTREVVRFLAVCGRVGLGGEKVREQEHEKRALETE